MRMKKMKCLVFFLTIALLIIGFIAWFLDNDFKVSLNPPPNLGIYLIPDKEWCIRYIGGPLKGWHSDKFETELAAKEFHWSVTPTFSAFIVPCPSKL